jgi:calcineurin B family protein 1
MLRIMELIYSFIALVPFVNQHFLSLISVAFRMYDLKGDEKISKEELLAVLTMMMGANICEEQLISIAERTIMEADTNNDNLISFDEFKKVLERTDVEQNLSIRFLS